MVVAIGSSMIAIGQPSFKRVHIYIQTGNTWSRLLTLNGDRPSGQYLIELCKIVSVSDKYVSVSSTGIETVGLPIGITEVSYDILLVRQVHTLWS